MKSFPLTFVYWSLFGFTVVLGAPQHALAGEPRHTVDHVLSQSPASERSQIRFYMRTIRNQPTSQKRHSVHREKNHRLHLHKRRLGKEKKKDLLQVVFSTRDPNLLSLKMAPPGSPHYRAKRHPYRGQEVLFDMHLLPSHPHAKHIAHAYVRGYHPYQTYHYGPWLLRYTSENANRPAPTLIDAATSDITFIERPKQFTPEDIDVHESGIKLSRELTPTELQKVAERSQEGHSLDDTLSALSLPVEMILSSTADQIERFYPKWTRRMQQIKKDFPGNN